MRSGSPDRPQFGRVGSGSGRPNADSVQCEIRSVPNNPPPSLALKLDKYDGVVYELVTNRGFIKSKDDTYAWQRTRRVAHPQDTGKVSGQVNYQIAASRVGPLLINIQTGAAWLLSRDPAKDEAYWWPILPQSGVVLPGE